MTFANDRSRQTIASCSHFCAEAIVQQQYEDRVLKPLLGSDSIYQGRHIQLTPEYAAALSQLHQLQLAQQAWLEHDHTVFPDPVNATPGASTGILQACASTT